MSPGTRRPTSREDIRRRLRRHARRRRIPAVGLIPTLCTLGNLVAGFAAVHYAAKPIDFDGPWGWTGLTLAGILIFVGMFLDGVDGSIARLTRSSSSLGAQLDALCDMVTFGVAPAFMGLRLVINHLESTASGAWIIGPEGDSVLGKVVWGVAAAYVCCTCLRLARFNVESRLDSVNDHRLFRGLPSPGAAGAVASLIILHQHLLVVKFGGQLPHELVQWASLLIPLVMLLCAIAMVSSIPYKHITNTYLRGPQNFAFIARLVIVLALAIWWLQETLAIAFTLYAASGPSKLAWRRLRHKPAKSRPQSKATATASR